LQRLTEQPVLTSIVANEQDLHKSTFKHFVLTRYNLSIRGRPQWVSSKQNLDPVWLEKRYRLFEQYTLPSLAKQSTKNFTWFLMVHPSTPSDYLTRLRKALQATAINFYLWSHTTDWIVHRSEEPSWRKFLIQAVGEHVTHLITTRIDSDDAIHSKFVGEVQQAFSDQDRMFLEFENGYILEQQTGSLYRTSRLSNPFVSLIERKTPDLSTVFCGDHAKLREIGKFKSLDARPSWMQVNHGTNLSNKSVAGSLVSSGHVEVFAEFGIV
jgi:hypothetical protein